MSLPGRPAQQLEADLISALETGGIEMLFQPQFACDGNRLVGAEALARWQHPELGRIGAAALFAIAERAIMSANCPAGSRGWRWLARANGPCICACRSTSLPPIWQRAILPIRLRARCWMRGSRQTG